MRADEGTARQHGERLAASLSPSQRDTLRSDPIEAIEAIFDVAVTVEDIRERTCPVAGSYERDGGPRIKVGRARSPGRTLFTALHELGHHLIYDDPSAQDWCFSRDGEPEELIANAFAAAIIFDDAVVNECIPLDGPTAYAVAELFGRSHASREACCVRAAQRLRTNGAVLIARDGAIQFAAPRGLPFRIARELEQDENSLFDRATRTEGAHQAGSVKIRLGPDRYSETFFADAYTVDGYGFMVLVSDNPPWGGLSVREPDEQPDGPDLLCERCGRYFEAVWRPPCRKCGDPPCPACNRCSCEPARPASRKCKMCGVDLPLAAPAGVELCDFCG